MTRRMYRRASPHRYRKWILWHLRQAAIITPALWFGTASAAFAAPVEPVPGGGQTTLRQECHHNAKGQLVCRMCWNEHGRVRCRAPRIVR